MRRFEVQAHNVVARAAEIQGGDPVLNNSSPNGAFQALAEALLECVCPPPPKAEPEPIEQLTIRPNCRATLVEDDVVAISDTTLGAHRIWLHGPEQIRSLRDWLSAVLTQIEGDK